MNDPASPVPVVCLLSEGSIPDILRIEQESNRPPWSKKVLSNEFQHSFSSIYGARVGGGLRGFLVVHVVLDEAHIMNFGISVDYRGRGIGKALLGEVLDTLHWQGVKKVFLEVRASNKIARSLYESFEFNQLGIRRSYY